MSDQNPMRIAEEMRRRLQHVPAGDKLWVGIEESMDGLCSVAELLVIADALEEERKRADGFRDALLSYGRHKSGFCYDEEDGPNAKCFCGLSEILNAERRNS